MISALDTHETVKSLTAAGFTDAQAEALTAAVRQAVDIDLSNIATKTDIADLRREIADTKAELVKWVVGVGFAQVATILGCSGCLRPRNLERLCAPARRRSHRRRDPRNQLPPGHCAKGANLAFAAKSAALLPAALKARAGFG